MLDSAILDVVIGIIFVFLLVSTLCSALREVIEQIFKTRAAYLERAIRELLQDGKGEGLAKAFYEHPLVFALYRNGYAPRSSNGELPLRGGDLPSYIPARTFANAIIDLTLRGPVTDAASAHPEFATLSFESLRESVGNLQSPPVQRALLSAIDNAQGSLEAVRENLEAWFDDAMQRASGWYKRHTQKIIFYIALFVACALNVNTITIAHHLYADETLRKTVVAAAEKTAELPTQQRASQQLVELALPIGWHDGWGAPIGFTKRVGLPFSVWNDVFAPLLGLLITAIAAMLGAPFWFDVLQKVMVIRATVKPADTTKPSAAAASARTPAPAALPAAAAATAAAAAAPAAGAAQPQPPPQPPPTPSDGDYDLCGRATDDEPTEDEDLPPARGGVAR